MPSVRTAWRRITDPSLRIATIVGLASIPVSLYLSHRSGPDSIVLTPVAVAGLVVGYHYADRPTSSGSAGVRTGLVGGSPLLWQTADILATAWGGAPSSSALAAAFALAYTVLGFCLAAFSGLVSAGIGDWVYRKSDRIRSGGATS